MNRIARFELTRVLRGLSLLAFSGGLLLSPVVWAEPSAAETGAAQAQYRKAYQAMASKEWTEARRLLLELWGRAHTYDVAASLGQVEYHLKNYADGARYMSFAIANVPPKEKVSTVDHYRAALAELKSHVASVRISVNPPVSEVRVDGRATDGAATAAGAAFTATDMYVDPGVHTFEARRADVRTGKTVEVAAGRAYSLVLSLPSGGADAATGAAAPSSPASKAAAISGQSAGSGQAASCQPAGPGPSGGSGPRSEQSAAALQANGSLSGSVQSTGPGGPNSRTLIPAYVGAGTALTAGILAVGFGLTAQSQKSDAEALRASVGGPSACTLTPNADTCLAAQDGYDAQRRNAHIANAAWAVAGVATAFTVGYWVWARSGWIASESEHGASTRPAVRPTASFDRTGGALWVTGWF